MFRRRVKEHLDERKFVDWLDERYGVRPTTDLEGLALADELADRLKYLSGESREFAEVGLTQFTAEVLRNSIGGTWDDRAGTLAVGGQPTWNVRGWVAKRLHLGRTDSLMAKVKVAISMVSGGREPDWDHQWPEDAEASAELSHRLGVDDSARTTIDAELVSWLSIRKTVYLDRGLGLGRRPSDDELDQIRIRLIEFAASEDVSAASRGYALARRYKAHAWLQHWRFGNSLGGPSSYLGGHDERTTVKLAPSEIVAVADYLASAPRYRDDAVLEMLWRIQKASSFDKQASPDERTHLTVRLLGLVSEAHPWHATKHIKRLFQLADPEDVAFTEALRDSTSDHWPWFWLIVLQVALIDGPNHPGDRFQLGRDALTWLDGARGSSPSSSWQQRRGVLDGRGPTAIRGLTAWLCEEGEKLRRTPDTGEVVPSVARWVKSATWDQEGRL